MAKAPPKSDRRADALTRDRIVDAAMELLDSDGETGLTFRALATRLDTGHGAIQWHVANKSELLNAATATAVARAVGDVHPDALPREAIHAIALGVFDAIDAHAWIGGHLAHPPWRDTMLRIFERIGRQVRALGVPISAQFTATSALLHYIIGASSQNATNSRSLAALGDREHLLDTEAAHWAKLDPDEYAFTRTLTEQLHAHDDRAEFLAGIDLILAGTTAPNTPG
ncbi:MAG TPA: TetR family transcriptional regulator [Micromonosporaceae bacterium]